jgi:DNA polymerase
MRKRAELKETLADLSAFLRQMSIWGCRGFDCSQQNLKRLAAWSEVPPEPEPAGTLEEISAQWADCRRCGLSGTRTRIVFGEGHAKARLVFVGEGPGKDEDASGRPFVGPAGQLLTRIIEAMNLTREQVYICNVVKCRPPGNRDPLPEEKAACRPLLDRQLDVIQPEVICTLGKCASQTLLETDAPISELRGRFFPFKGVKLMPTYHPAFLLRNPAQKRAVWEDIKKIMALLRLSR